jgi:hypothetical protein
VENTRGEQCSERLINKPCFTLMTDVTQIVSGVPETNANGRRARRVRIYNVGSNKFDPTTA